MNIVILDGYTLNPGDLSWKALEMLGHTTVYDRTPQEEILDRCETADIVLTNKTVLDADIISKFKKVVYIGVLATGYNVVDMEMASSKNITVTNVPAYGPSSVAQHTFSLLLSLTNQAQLHAQSVENAEWSEVDDFCYTLTPLTNLEGKTFGVIGYGNIGRRVARIADAFGMEVLIHSKSANTVEVGKLVSQNELVKQSDVVSLHCALTSDNVEMVNKSFLAKMKSNAIILNTSRGPLINESDLAHELQLGKIAGAGLDVLSTEPPNRDNPLIGAKNCIITPHIAWATKEARQNLLNIAVENVKAFINGSPVNVIG